MSVSPKQLMMVIFYLKHVTISMQTIVVNSRQRYATLIQIMRIDFAGRHASYAQVRGL